MKVTTAFIGLSHLGLSTSIAWASLKRPLFAIDSDISIVKKLKSGEVKIAEPRLLELLKKSRKYYFPERNFKNLKNCDLVFISLDTPTDKPNSLKNLDSLIDQTIPYLKQNVLIALMSQVPIGYTRKLHKRIKRARPDLNFKLVYFLNTIIIGSAVDRFLHPERIVLGLNDKNQEIPKILDHDLKIFNCPIIKMSYESAEMTKSAVNLLLAASISAANNLADMCEVTGADINEIIPALKLDKRIGPFTYLKPTIRISGGHLERELIKFQELAKKFKISPGIAKSILDLNENRFRWVENKFKKLLPKVTKINIAIWGLSYKKDTQSVENAVSLKLIHLFKSADIKAYDPMAILPKGVKIKRVKNKYEALQDADCLMILTDWDEFSKADFKKIRKLMRIRLIIDCVGIWYNQRKNLKDFQYVTPGVGQALE